MKNLDVEYIVKHFFKKSEKQIGFLYCAEVNKTYINSITKEIWREKQYKYGKTKDIDRRFKMYGESYTLLNKYKVNHLSLRENLIRSDWDIQDDRRYKDARGEHVDFDCSDIVQLYANCEIRLEYNDDDNNNLRFYCYDGKEWFTSRDYWEILECFHL